MRQNRGYLVTELPRTPYHIAEQNAAALLGPIAAELAVLEERLARYHDRVHMSASDRAAMALAREAVGAAVVRVRGLVS